MCKNILEVMHSIRCYTDNTCIMYPEPPNSKEHTIEELEWIHGKLADVRESMEEFVNFDEHFIKISRFVCHLQKIIDEAHAQVMQYDESSYEHSIMVRVRHEFKECYNAFLERCKEGFAADQYVVCDQYEFLKM